MKKGFTLVELSIVLVIIGLLIGGILVAQSLIDSTKVSQMIRNLQQYEAAIQLFKSNYKYYPGDSSHFTPAGNANHELDGSVCTGVYSAREGYQFWTHLSQSGMLKTNYVPYQPIYCGGTHANSIYDDSLADLIAPYTHVTSISSYLPIRAEQISPNHNLVLYVRLDPIDTLAVESKIGSKDSNGSSTQLGLVNYNDVGNCFIWPSTQVSCSDTSIGVQGSLGYYIAP